MKPRQDLWLAQGHFGLEGFGSSMALRSSFHFSFPGAGVEGLGLESFKVWG